MLRAGCHLSSSKGFLHMGKEALQIGANTFQFFTRNPRGSRAKAIDPEDVKAYLQFAGEHGIGQILGPCPVHAECLFQRGEDAGICAGDDGR